ncbi:ureide permease 1 isoform X1 [Selaginella moellendorffii]|uniref:ureide permease 1 isoform X1 n=1 Tax=Selaginella moellendorffii TaxID=88036 RepID=UPI000D1CD9D1|nr:ureide permease 1 isoform X1 [Selaginella moellendorffii]|eukprot:XP_024534406.1 ureide permease 1 isoform X1 [Selaginella moellendorffii]
MYFVTDRGWAILLMLCSLWCLGTWPIFFNIAERRGRLPQHTYIDYAISTFAVAVIFALTLGQIGDSDPSAPNFIQQLSQVYGFFFPGMNSKDVRQDNLPCVLIAMAGGIALCLGNICMQYSLVFVGISITEVISASLAVIFGTTANYYLDNCLNSARVLFPGVGCFVIAVLLGSFCHASNANDRTARLGPSNPRCEAEQDLHTNLLKSSLVDLIATETSSSFMDLEEQRAVKVRDSSVMFGLVLAFITGMCYGFFSPLFNIATNDQFHLLNPQVPHLVIYTSFFYFSTAFLVLGVLINVYLLYYPVLGLPKSSLSAYLSDWKGRELAILAGLVCGFGNGFQFMGGQAAGYAAADAVQALPLVGTLWGVLLFGEYRGSSHRTLALLVSMLVMFSVAVALLIASARER